MLLYHQYDNIGILYILFFYMTGDIVSTSYFGLFGHSLMTFIGIGGICLLILLYCIVTYNSIIRAKNTVDESFSSIDTVLQNRYDLIPNLIATVKQYMQHESWIMEKVSEMRAKLLSTTDKTSAERFATENELQAGMKSIFALSENYPDLKASNNFLELQTQWSEIEDRLQGARRAYNAAVKEIRNKQETFPSNIVAKIAHIKPYEMFEAVESARTNLDAKSLFNS